MRWRATGCASCRESHRRRCRWPASTPPAPWWPRSSAASTRSWAADPSASALVAVHQAANQLAAHRVEERLKAPAVDEALEPARLLFFLRRRLRRLSLCGRLIGRSGLGGSLVQYFVGRPRVDAFAVLGLQRAGLGGSADRVVADRRHQRTR